MEDVAGGVVAGAEDVASGVVAGADDGELRSTLGSSLPRAADNKQKEHQ